MTNPVSIHCWKANHVSGTKFYQVIRFISESGSSFSLRQNGPAKIFTGLGKMATGTIELDDHQLVGKSAGLDKIGVKEDDAYVKNVEKSSFSLSSVLDAKLWCAENFGKKAMDIADMIMSSAQWAGSHAPIAVNPPIHLEVVTPIEADEPKSEQWGSW